MRVDGQETSLVEGDEVVLEGVGFAGQGSLTPGQGGDFLVEVLDKSVGNVHDGGWLTPLLAVGIVGAGQSDTVCVQFTKGGRARVTPAAVGELIPVLGAKDVGLVAVAPEDGTNILVATPKTLGGLPGQGLLKRTLGARSPFQLLEDHACGLSQVHGVEVQVVDAIGEEGAAQVGHQSLSDLTDGNIIVLDGLHGVHPILGDLDVQVLGSAEETGISSDGHDTGDNGDSDATLADLFDPADEVVGVVGHLGDDEGGAHVDLVLEVVEQ